MERARYDPLVFPVPLSVSRNAHMDRMLLMLVNCFDEACDKALHPSRQDADYALYALEQFEALRAVPQVCAVIAEIYAPLEALFECQASFFVVLPKELLGLTRLFFLGNLGSALARFRTIDSELGLRPELLLGRREVIAGTKLAQFAFEAHERAEAAKPTIVKVKPPRVEGDDDCLNFRHKIVIDAAMDRTGVREMLPFLSSAELCLTAISLDRLL
jgi:hypothetical protein